MSTDTKVLPQIINDNTKTMNDKNDDKSTSCTPRNALFCCSSPVCLTISAAPKILPIDYHYQQVDNNNDLIAINNINNNNNNITTNQTVNDELRNGEQTKLDNIKNLPLSVPDLAKMSAMTNTNGIIINGDATNHENNNEQEQKKERRRIRTPPAPNLKFGTLLKKVTPPKTKITVKHNDGPMLGVVLRKVEKKVEPVKSILDDNKPLYHLTVVRNGDNSKSSGNKINKQPPVEQRKISNTTSNLTNAKKTADTNNNAKNTLAKPTNNTAINQIKKPTTATVSTKAQPRMPITVQKIEGDKIIIIKKIPVPKNGKLPPHLLHLQII